MKPKLYTTTPPSTRYYSSRVGDVDQSSQYMDKVLHIQPSNLLGYWPLNETSGTVAHDYSGNGYNGAINDCLLGQAGIGDGQPSPYFNGISSYIDVSIPALLASFPWDSGTLMVWQLIDADATGSLKRCVRVGTSNIDYALTFRSSVDSFQQVGYYTLNEWGGYVAIVPRYTGYFCTIMSWRYSTTTGKTYFEAMMQNSTVFDMSLPSISDHTILPATGMTIGMHTDFVTDPWKGYLAHVALWNIPLSTKHMSGLSVL